MQFPDRIPADYLERVDLSDLYRRGVRGGGGSGPLVWGSPIHIEVSSFEGNEQYMNIVVPDEKRWLYGGKLNFKIPLVTTPGAYGGKRFWFSCPFCTRRVGVLYRRDDRFACRHCQNLTYESKNLSGIEKGMGRIISIPELEAIENKVKRINYNGKPTRKYLRYLKIEQKFRFAIGSRVKALQKRIRLNKDRFSDDFPSVT